MQTMDQSPQWRGVEPALRALQVITGSLLAGLLSFTGVVLAMQIGGTGPTPAGPVPENMMLILMGVLTLGTLVAGLVIRRLHVGQLRKLADEGVEMSDQLLMMRFNLVTVLRGALAEGPALFATAIVMLSGNMLGFAGTAFGAFVLLAIFPTRGKFDRFVRDATGEAPRL